MYDFKLPDLGEGIHEGEILKWHVEIGENITEDEPLVDVETDKAAITIPSPKSGKIEALNGKVGDVVMVGDVVVTFDDGSGPSESAPAAKEEAAAGKKYEEPVSVTASGGNGAQKVAAPSQQKVAEPPAPAAATHARNRAIAVPATRRLAREMGIDINLVIGTGPAGRVTPDDLKQFSEGGAPPAADKKSDSLPECAVDPSEDAYPLSTCGIPFLDLEPLPDFEQWGPVTKEPLRSIRRKVARRMVTSMVLVPHVAHMDEADVTLLEEFRKKEQQRRQGSDDAKLTLLPFIIKAVTAGLKAAPSFNASLDPVKEEIVYKNYYNIGIAVDTGHGLVVPVIRETDRKSILTIASDLDGAAKKARAGELEVADLRGGTFTITNVGPLGGTALIPTINYPEVAILGMGRVQEKPVVRDGQIVIRKILPLTLAFDHRIADGADAARFVTEMVRQLSDPNLLLLET